MRLATHTAVINRTHHDIKYGSKLSFKGIDGKAIDDDFTLSFSGIA
ncbi:hypothetical protein [Hymenobacter sp. YC55]|nr:hypothetical protein [Hymenobacter sp. YC55]MDF7813949.1 hypothetical protein [Hymenobacter sp. YC55]